jgi:hypothetical protein
LGSQSVASTDGPFFAAKVADMSLVSVLWPPEELSTMCVIRMAVGAGKHEQSSSPEVGYINVRSLIEKGYYLWNVIRRQMFINIARELFRLLKVASCKAGTIGNEENQYEEHQTGHEHSLHFKNPLSTNTIGKQQTILESS